MPVPVIGIGTSAGGLDALLGLLAELPVSDFALVVAQHMARNEHTELVASLLSKAGRWPVAVPEDRCRIQSGRLYLLPAQKDGFVCKGEIRLIPPAPDSYSSPSVNQLFYSLAAEYQEQALAIVLSGAGSDGAEGAATIRRRQGRIWIQDPAEAQYDSMPLSARKRFPDALIAGVAEMAQRLIATEHIVPESGHPLPDASVGAPAGITSQSLPDVEALSGSDKIRVQEELLQRTLDCIGETTGVSFRGYKTETLQRRLEKRMQVLGITDAGDYLTHLQADRDEALALQQFLLISVSAFFRDQAVFDRLPPLLMACAEQKAPTEAVRILVSACATGEEAYSLAILCHHLIPEQPVQIIATDLNTMALERARRGRYPLAKTQSVPVELQKTAFEYFGDTACIKPEIRRMITWQQSDLMTMPLPDNLDFVFCRNLLIYLKRAQQDQLIRKFHRVMSAGSVLVLGFDESLSPDSQRCFCGYDAYHRIFTYRADSAALSHKPQE